MQKKSICRFAAHKVLTPEGPLSRAFVEIVNGRVTGWHSFLREPPFTEWVGGTIELRTDDSGCLRAWHGEVLLC